MSQNSFSFFDFDNTIYRGQSSYLLLDFSTYLEASGLFESVEFSKINSLFTSYYQGKINRHDFGFLVVESYYRGLSECNEIEIRKQAYLYWDRFQDDAWFPYTLQLLNLANRNTKSILVSGSPLEVLEIIYKTLGFTKLFASKGIIQNGVYTGLIEQEMATSTAKANLLQELSKTVSFDPSTSFAFGDSESDFPLLEVVDPKNAYLLGASADLKTQVLNRNWNLLDQEKEILKHVNSRINTLFPY